MCQLVEAQGPAQRHICILCVVQSVALAMLPFVLHTVYAHQVAFRLSAISVTDVHRKKEKKKKKTKQLEHFSAGKYTSTPQEQEPAPPQVLAGSPHMEPIT